MDCLCLTQINNNNNNNNIYIYIYIYIFVLHIIIFIMSVNYSACHLHYKDLNSFLNTNLESILIKYVICMLKN